MATLARSFAFAVAVTGCTFPSPFPEVIPPAPAPMPQPCRTNEQGVVLCVDFEDASLAGQAIDRSPHQNHAVARDVGSIPREPPGEQAAQLSNASSLRVRESASLDLATFTIEMWIRPDRAQPKGKDGGKTDHGLFDNHGHYAMRIREDLKIRCGIGPDAAARVSSESAVPGQTWSHVACTYAGGEMRVYVNGHLSDCQALVAPAFASDRGSAIGAEIDPAGLDGLRDRFLGGVDNVRIYDRALDGPALCAAAGHTGACPDECPSTGDGGDDGPGGFGGPGGPGGFGGD